ncbi:hypothetical protein A2U01_0020880, partial [Trifolium medium]|nr:hypothetical protein [Trifolium medium]
MNARIDAIFTEINAKLEILMQLSFHGEANSSTDIPNSEPLNVNLPIQDEIRSSAKQ